MPGLHIQAGLEGNLGGDGGVITPVGHLQKSQVVWRLHQGVVNGSRNKWRFQRQSNTIGGWDSVLTQV